MTTQPTNDINQKRYELMSLWDSTYSVLRKTVDSVKAGQPMRASMLKELVAFLTLSGDLLGNAWEYERSQPKEAPVSFDIRQKRQQRLELWNDTFEIAKATIEAFERGEGTIRGSMLHEIVKLMKLSEHMILDQEALAKQQTSMLTEEEERSLFEDFEKRMAEMGLPTGFESADG